jgi:hypothetical protein
MQFTLGKSNSKIPINSNLDKLVQKWREKVFDCLLTNKRYEVIIKDNLKQYSQELKSLEKEVEQANS